MEQPATAQICAYCVEWGSTAHRDDMGQYFTAETELALRDGLPLVAMVLDEHDLLSPLEIGIVTRLAPDRQGVWCQASLDLDNHFARHLMGVLEQPYPIWHLSTMADIDPEDEDYVADDGRVLRWPLVAVVVNPTAFGPAGVTDD